MSQAKPFPGRVYFSPKEESHKPGDPVRLDPCKIAAAIKMNTKELETFVLSLGFDEEEVRRCERNHSLLVAILKGSQDDSPFLRAYKNVTPVGSLPKARQLNGNHLLSEVRKSKKTIRYSSASLDTPPPKTLGEAIKQEAQEGKYFKVNVRLPNGKNVKGRVTREDSIGDIMARLNLSGGMGLVLEGRMLKARERVMDVGLKAGMQLLVHE